MSSEQLRNIPAVDQLLLAPPLEALAQRVSREVVVRAIRARLDQMRADVLGSDGAEIPPVGQLADEIAGDLIETDRASLRPVINATGVLLHTGLGRAPLAAEALEEMAAVGRGYASVEIDLRSGKRSQRVAAVERLLIEQTGAEAAVVVNNNAGATMLALAAIAGQGGEVIVSRGELIEIGGSFRLPDVMQISGAKLCEVGTTNKTRLADYRNAICDATAGLMLVHTSNYVVLGFSEATSLDDLVSLGKERDLPVIHDIGSGALVDLSQFGCHEEPVAADSVRAGADLVLFSGDKLLGGPQCGIIVGRKAWIQKIARHPLMRALRVDKLTLAALAATLRLYRDPRILAERLPLVRLLSTPMEELQLRAEKLAAQLCSAPCVAEAGVVDDVAYLGGGSVPGKQLPTCCVWIEPDGLSLDELATRLRGGPVAVMGRLSEDRLLLDLKSVEREQDADIAAAFAAIETG